MSGMSSDENHFHGVYNGDTLTVIVCSALALYNALELEALVLSTFTAYRGLYFWSLCLASFGIIPYVLGYAIEYFQLTYLALGIAIDWSGWVLMVTGQSMVLYSRLWLVFSGRNHRLLSAVKWMIIINAIVLHGTTCVAVFGSHFSGQFESTFGDFYNVVERIQMSVFFIQEFILSSLYIWKAVDIIRISEWRRSHSLMWRLFSINLIIIVLDIGLLIIEFMSLHVLQQTVKGVTYSIKLKLELAVLNRLIELSSAGHRRATTFTFGDTNDFVDPTKTKMDIKRFTPALASSKPLYPKWKSDLEKSGIQQVASVDSPTESTCIQCGRKDTTMSPGSDYFANDIQPMSAAPASSVDAREIGSETDLLYADAVRTLSKSK